MRVLLVEDDELLGGAIEQALADAAITVDRVRDGVSALAATAGADYEVILLDLGLPERDGMSVLRSMRDSGGKTPIIIITARDALENRIEGLDAGADDYLVKPFSVEELQARMRAVIRRHANAASPQLGSGELTLDPQTRNVQCRGENVALSAREYAVMHALMLRPGRILSREELEGKVYGWDDEVSSNAIEVVIHGLRRKLGRKAIRNVRGLGWMVEQG